MGFDLQGRRVLVTGASGGIGAAIARALHAKGATVLLTARRKEVIDELAASLGDRAETIAADLSAAAGVQSLIEQAGAVDVLVANAGVPASGNFTTFKADEVDRALDVNLRAPMQLTLALIPGMQERGHGHLVYISSISGKVASGGASVYNATKFGLRGWALGLRDDLRPTGIGVTTVFPGFISDAGMFAESGTELPPFVGTRTTEQVADGVLSAIDKDRAEVSVAPLSVRAGAAAAGLMPSRMAAIQRRLGAQKIADSMSEGQRAKR